MFRQQAGNPNLYTPCLQLPGLLPQEHGLFFFSTSLRFVSLSPQNISTTVTSTEKLESLIMEKDEGGGLQKEGIIKKKKKSTENDLVSCIYNIKDRNANLHLSLLLPPLTPAFL